MTKDKQTFYSDRLPPKKVEPEEISELEAWIGSTRRLISSEFQTVHSQASRITNVWIEKEREWSEMYTHYHDKREKLLPGLIYVTIAGFGGSILTKNSTDF
jgi:hypothetical protein